MEGKCCASCKALGAWEAGENAISISPDMMTIKWVLISARCYLAAEEGDAAEVEGSNVKLKG